jgi:hypothetical protein
MGAIAERVAVAKAAILRRSEVFIILGRPAVVDKCFLACFYFGERLAENPRTLLGFGNCPVGDFTRRKARKSSLMGHKAIKNL